MNFKIFILYFCVLIKYSYTAQKKNVVVIVADDLGWNDVSFHGSNQFLTPNIDALAYSGVILHNYYVLPLCSPSRSAFMTGVHPIHSGMYHRVLLANTPYGLPLDLKILPQYLKEYGYKTRAVGKWHLGHYKKVYTPTYRGFDSHFGYWTSHEDYYHHDEIDLMSTKGYDFRRGMNTTWNHDGQYATDLFTQESVDIISSHNTSEPLFLYLAHLACHSANPRQPLQAPPEIIEKFSYIKNKQRRIFAAMVWKLDESVGKVVQALADKNMLEDTIIIFTTDNGGPAAGFNQNQASNWPLRGVKDTIWEGGVRGASFVWSADLPHSKVSNALMHIQDWLPTILGAVDENVEKNSTLLEGLDGRNMWPVLKGDKDSEYDELIIQRDLVRGISALRKNNWKVVKGNTYKGLYDKWYGPTGREKNYSYNVTTISSSPVAETLTKHNFPIPSKEKMTEIRANITLSCDYCKGNETLCTPCTISSDKICLFDVSLDPCEENNLAAKYPDVLANMTKIMSKYVPVAPLNKPIDLRADPIRWNRTWVNWMDYVSEIPASSTASEMIIVDEVPKLQFLHLQNPKFSPKYTAE
ncbi:arylsulfatase B-like [Planococcus citri]|uniref:arylsulfatase B-like n=1 Tax=Planococcus citri TaxID=170843 RepID=UPI0031F951E9